MFSTLQKGLEIFGFFKIVCNGEGHCNTNVRKEHIFYAPRFSSTFAHNEFTYMLKILHKSENTRTYNTIYSVLNFVEMYINRFEHIQILFILFSKIFIT